MQSFAKDLGFDISVCIHSGACAAIGITRRRGLGKITFRWENIDAHINDIYTMN